MVVVGLAEEGVVVTKRVVVVFPVVVVVGLGVVVFNMVVDEGVVVVVSENGSVVDTNIVVVGQCW